MNFNEQADRLTGFVNNECKVIFLAILTELAKKPDVRLLQDKINELDSQPLVWWPTISTSYRRPSVLAYKDVELEVGSPSGRMNYMELHFPDIRIVKTYTGQVFDAATEKWAPKLQQYNTSTSTSAHGTTLDDLYESLVTSYKRWLSKKNKAEKKNKAILANEIAKAV